MWWKEKWLSKDQWCLSKEWYEWEWMKDVSVGWAANCCICCCISLKCPRSDSVTIVIWYVGYARWFRAYTSVLRSQSDHVVIWVSVSSAVPKRTWNHTESRNHRITRNSHILGTWKPEPRKLNLFLFLHSLDPWSIILSYSSPTPIPDLVYKPLVHVRYSPVLKLTYYALRSWPNPTIPNFGIFRNIGTNYKAGAIHKLKPSLVGSETQNPNNLGIPSLTVLQNY